MPFNMPFSHLARLVLPCLLVIALNLTPGNRQAGLALDRANLAQSIGRSQQIAIELRRVAEIEPWREDLWPRIGRAEYDSHNYRSAVQAFRLVGANAPLSDGDRCRLGEAYFLLGDRRAAILTWQPLLENGTAPAEVFEKVLNVQRAERDYRSAAETARLWFRTFPATTEAQYQQALFVLMIRPEDALPILMELSNREQPYASRANTLLKAVNTAMLESNLAYRNLNIGRSLAYIGQWDLSRQELEEALRLAPDYAEAWALLSEARRQLGLDGEAEIKKAYQLNPRSALILTLYARYWRQHNRADIALTYLYDVAGLESTSALWQVELGSTLVDLGELQLALGHYQRAAEMEPNNLTYWQTLARFCITHHIEARTIGLPAARQALSLAPEDPIALDLIGWVFLNLGDYDSAERFLQQALQKDNLNPAIYLHLGQVYLHEEKNEQAVPLLKLAASMGDDKDPAALTARRLLSQHANIRQ